MRGAVERDLFAEWLYRRHPERNWNSDMLLEIRERLAKVTSGQRTRLIVTLPPRHYKTTLATEYAAFMLSHQPDFHVLYATYDQGAAQMAGLRVFSGLAVAELAHCETYSRLDLHSGSGFRAVGVGQVACGFGADLLLVDDPIMGYAEAGDPAIRERVWQWYRDALRTRLKPGAAVVVFCSRWHEADLVGRLYADSGDEWETLRLPALAWEDDPLGRKGGEPLLREKPWYEGVREGIGADLFAALYQQSPLGEFIEPIYRESAEPIFRGGPVS